METRIRERLVGAIALVAIVVVLVPELLTGPRTSARRAADDAAAPVRSVTIDLAAVERGTIARPAPSAAAATAAAATTPAVVAPPPQGSPLAAPSPPPAATPAPIESPLAATPMPATPGIAAVDPQGWVVQLGSFASRDNAERFATSLRAKGYTAFVAEFRGSGRVLYRVRVGPEQDRARAEAIGARLAREGHRGSIAPQP
jgi:DedD protein